MKILKTIVAFLIGSVVLGLVMVLEVVAPIVVLAAFGSVLFLLVSWVIGALILEKMGVKL